MATGRPLHVGDKLFNFGMHGNSLLPRKNIRLAGEVRAITPDYRIEIRRPGEIPVGATWQSQSFILDFHPDDFIEGFAADDDVGYWLTEEGMATRCPLTAYLNNSDNAILYMTLPSVATGHIPTPWAPPTCGNFGWVTTLSMFRLNLIAVRTPPDSWCLAWCEGSVHHLEALAWNPAHTPISAASEAEMIKHLGMLGKVRHRHKWKQLARIRSVVYDLHLYADQLEDAGRPDGETQGFHDLANNRKLLGDIICAKAVFIVD